jgi:hypothetical protein
VRTPHEKLHPRGGRGTYLEFVAEEKPFILFTITTWHAKQWRIQILVQKFGNFLGGPPDPPPQIWSYPETLAKPT